MDPYLERPALWPDVHNALIAALRDALGPVLRPKYFVALEERVYTDGPGGLTLIGRPDLSVTPETGAVLHALYERASYDLVIDYKAEPGPPLAEADRAYAHEVLAGAKLR